MDRIFMFDIDGTLTPSRLMMTKEFAKFFDKWSNKNKYYLVTGSDLDKTKEQLQGRTPKKVIVVPGKIVNIVG